MELVRAGWLVGVAVVAFLLFFRGSALAVPPQPDLAAIASVRGELKTARSLLLSRLQKSPRDARALFVLACVCLQENDLTGARDAAKRFAAVVPSAPEASVLFALVEERSRPEVAWSTAFIAAFRRAGVPATPTMFQDGLSTQRAIDQDTVRRLDAAERLLVEYATSRLPKDSLTQDALALSKRQDLSVPVGLTIYFLLSASPEHRGAAGAVIHSLAERHPEAAYLGLAVLLDSTSKDAPFSSQEIARIKKEVARHGSAPHRPLTALYEAFKQAVAKVDPAAAHEAAFSATMGPSPAAIPTSVLNGRAQATAAQGSEAERAELGAALAQLGRSLAGGSCLTDLGLGRLFLTRAAELSGDPDLAHEASTATQTLSEMIKRAEFLKFVAQWPIAPLQRELNDRKVDGELTLLKEFPAAP